MAYRGYEPLGMLRDGFHRDHPLRRTGQRIAAQVHRRSAGMVGVSRPRESVPRLAHDGCHSGNAQVLCLKNRTLFDVYFEEAQHICSDGRLVDLRGIEPECADRSLQRDAVGVFQREECSIESTGGRAAADKRHAKAHAFFFAEGDDFDGQR